MNEEGFGAVEVLKKSELSKVLDNLDKEIASIFEQFNKLELKLSIILKQNYPVKEKPVEIDRPERNSELVEIIQQKVDRLEEAKKILKQLSDRIEL